MKMEQNKEERIKINLDELPCKSEMKGANAKQKAKMAFKKHKNGLPVTDDELNLIAIYYPWLCSL